MKFYKMFLSTIALFSFVSLVSCVNTMDEKAKKTDNQLDFDSLNSEFDLQSSVEADSDIVFDIEEQESELNWSIKNGTLIISGKGSIPDYQMKGDIYELVEDPPWYVSGEDFNSVIIEEGITRIGDYAFFRPNSAFELTNHISSVKISNTVRSIGSRAFEGCIFSSIVIPGSVESIDYCAFGGCDELNTVEIEEGLKTIGSRAFTECHKLQTVHLPNTLNKLSEGAFYGCESLTEIVIPNSVTEMESSVFSGCRALTAITFSDNLTYIPEDTCCHCESLMSVVIPEGVTVIKCQAFESCLSLKSITIPNSLTKIEIGALERLPNLSEIIYFGTESSWNAIETSKYDSFHKSDKVRFVGGEA